MGVNSTKEFGMTSKNDDRRRSFEKPKSKPEIGMHNELLTLKADIDQFNGTENENQYKLYAKQLAAYSKALQDIKTATTKRDRHNEIDKAQQIINSCFVALHANKVNERNLDHAAVESHSFINGSNPSASLPRGRKNPKSWRKLESVENNIRTIESEVSKAMEIEDMGKFKFLEEKIKLLLADIETIPSGNDESLIEKKEEYTNKLLDIFKRMKSNERKIHRNSKADMLDIPTNTNNNKNQSATISKTNSDFDEYNLEILKEIDSKLVDLEVTILEFEDTSKDENYRDIRRRLTKLANQIHEMTNTSSILKIKQEKTIDLIDVLLNKAKRKAFKNETVLQSELKNIAEIEDVVSSLEQRVKVFKGKQIDQEYKIIDQGMRKQWDILNIVSVSLPTVKNYKSRVINKIKNCLKTLHDKSIEMESQSVFDTAESPNILEQTNKFEMHWHIIQCSIDSAEHSTNDLVLALTKLEEVNQKINNKCKELQNKIRVKDEIKFDIHPGTYGTLNENNSTIQESARSVVVASIVAVASSPSVVSTTTTANSIIDVPNSTPETSTTVKTPALEGLPVGRIIQPMSSIDTYGKLQSIIRDVTSISVTIDEFHGTSKTQKYHEIYMLLKEREECLKSVDDLGVPSLQSAKVRGKAHVLKAIDRLQCKVLENESIEETSKQRPQDEITDIAKQMRKLRKQVESYSGHFKDAAYVEIEDGLQKCWGLLRVVDVGSNSKLQTVKNQTEEKICVYLQNLDERSIKIVGTEV